MKLLCGSQPTSVNTRQACRTPGNLCSVLGQKHTQRIKFLRDIKMRQGKLMS